MQTLTQKTFLFLLLCCGFFSWFHWGSPWYPAATLLVSGTVPDASSQISIRWDSGEGLNGYEWERYPLQKLPLQQDGTAGIPVTITRTGEYVSASLGPKVGLQNIFVDEQLYIPSPQELGPDVEQREGQLVFKADGAVLKLLLHPTSHLRFEFSKFNGAGKVAVQIGEETSVYDLYSSNNEDQWGGRNAKVVDLWYVTEAGEFTVSMTMPRYPVQSLRVRSIGPSAVSSVVVQTTDGQTLDVGKGVLSQQGIDYPMAEIDSQRKRYYHPHRFLFQLLFAFLTSCLVMALFRFASRFKGMADCFINEQRYLFWGMFLLSCLGFAFWHLSFWPGVTSTDSLEIWRAAQIPGMYLGDHPPLNVIFYLYLSQFWNNVAVVAIVQNLLTSLLIAHIFFSLFRRGLPLWCMIPCYTLIALSIPVGLYTIILWKDVPYALIVVFLGFKLAMYSFDKHKGHLAISWSSWFVVFILTLLLAGFRHNGVLYLFIVPFILLLFGIIRIRPIVLVLFSVLIFLGITLFFVSSGTSGKSNYLTNQSKRYLNQAMKQLSPDYLYASGRRYLGVFDVNQKNRQWDLVHLCMYGRYNNDFLRNVRWNDTYPFISPPTGRVIKKMQEAAWFLYWKSYEAPWVYFSWNPVFMLILLPLLPLLYRWLPMTAVFSLFVLMPVAVLVFLNILNWRYFYFAHLALYFVFPMLATDLFWKRRLSSGCSEDDVSKLPE